LTALDRPGWAFLFTYCAACAAIALPSAICFGGVLVCSALAAVMTLVGGGAGGAAIGFAASSVGVGLLMVLLRDLRTRNEELLEARAELAQLAVARERERFARDLHDLLGHTLSVIALKAELAGRLLPDRPAAAAGEMEEVEQVARQALTEVRQAVSGYRRPTLDGELEGARMALLAAGIEAEVERPQVTLDPAVEAVLAWAVREGATNVIRHSGARHCTLRISAGLADAAVEVLDDGMGADRGSGIGGAPGAASGGASGVDSGVAFGVANGSGEANGGHGLAGLAERAQSLRGRLEVGSAAEGGFRLAVTIPVS
jgi:two-component system sensor histidine kinase DesK